MSLWSCRQGHGAACRSLTATAMLLSLLLHLHAAPVWGETVPADPGDACMESLAAVHQPMTTLSKDAVVRFLKSVHSNDCRDHLEFEEWSTETIFDLMQDAPETFFGVLMRSPKSVQASVVKALDSPVDLFVDYPAVYESISTGIRDTRLRDYALSIFTPHYQRHLKEQKEWEQRYKPKGTAEQG